jgi:hypothetical protein
VRPGFPTLRKEREGWGTRRLLPGIEPKGADDVPARTYCGEKPRSQKRDLGHPLILANTKEEAFLCAPLRAPVASAFVPYRRRIR